MSASTTPAWIVSQAVTLADLRGSTRFAGLQVPYTLVERSAERDLLPMRQTLELTVTAWSPHGGGLLTGRYGSDRDRPGDTRIAADWYVQALGAEELGRGTRPGRTVHAGRASLRRLHRDDR
jgi:aryl-alcohol dehydrogenase-like predicted oxidoreductase